MFKIPEDYRQDVYKIRFVENREFGVLRTAIGFNELSKLTKIPRSRFITSICGILRCSFVKENAERILKEYGYLIIEYKRTLLCEIPELENQ